MLLLSVFCTFQSATASFLDSHVYMSLSIKKKKIHYHRYLIFIIIIFLVCYLIISAGLLG